MTPAMLLATLLIAPPGAIESEPEGSPPPPTEALAASPAGQYRDGSPGMGEAVGLAPPGIVSHLYGLSILGAEALPQESLGFAFGAGFPYVSALARYGATRNLGIGAELDSLYAEMELASLQAQWTVSEAPEGAAAIAFRFAVEHAFFAYSETTENGAAFGARWTTGERNDGASAALVVSTRLASGMTLTFCGTFELTADTEPQLGPPLSGPPPLLTLGFNVPLSLAFEVPIGARSNFVAQFGVDLHFRTILYQQDALAMPVLLAGIDADVL
ncbi:MAG: hypothetical protein ACYCWW_12850 [Deltaproteobacteria bacterium]